MAGGGYHSLVGDLDTTPPPSSTTENENSQEQDPVPHHLNSHLLATLDDQSLLQIPENQ
jgi:hypothetical protein